MKVIKSSSHIFCFYVHDVTEEIGPYLVNDRIRTGIFYTFLVTYYTECK